MLGTLALNELVLGIESFATDAVETTVTLLIYVSRLAKTPNLLSTVEVALFRGSDESIKRDIKCWLKAPDILRVLINKRLYTDPLLFRRLDVLQRVLITSREKEDLFP